MQVTLCLTCVKTCDEVPYNAVDQTTLMLGNNKLQVDDYITCALPSRVAHKMLLSIKKQCAYCTAFSTKLLPLTYKHNQNYFFMCNDYCAANSHERQHDQSHSSSSSSLHSQASLLCQQSAFNKAILIDVFRQTLQCKSVQNENNKNCNACNEQIKRKLLSSPPQSLSCSLLQASPSVENQQLDNIFDEIVLCSSSNDGAIGSSSGIRCEHLTDIENVKQVSDVLNDMQRIDITMLVNRRFHHSTTFHFGSRLSIMQLGTMIGSHQPCHVYLFVSSQQKAWQVRQLVQQWQGVKSLVQSVSCKSRINQNKISAQQSQVQIGQYFTSAEHDSKVQQQAGQHSQSKLVSQIENHTNGQNNNSNSTNYNRHNAQMVNELQQQVVRLRNQIQTMQNKSTFFTDDQRQISVSAQSNDIRQYWKAKCVIGNSSSFEQRSASAQQLLYANKQIARLTKEKQQMAKTIALQSNIIAEAKKTLLSLSQSHTNQVNSTISTCRTNKLFNTLSLHAMRKSTQKQGQQQQQQ